MAANTDNETCWQLAGCNVVSDEPVQRCIYVRALIDWGSCEFEQCELGYAQRLQIIRSVGATAILNVMAQIAKDKRRRYCVEVQGWFDLALLIRFSLNERIHDVFKQHTGCS